MEGDPPDEEGTGPGPIQPDHVAIDGAKPHQANSVANWLDSIIEDRMNAIKSRRGTPEAPHLST